MKYWFDTEFIEYPCTIDLISIGIVSEDTRRLYLVSSEFDESKASEWVKDNVISRIYSYPRYSRAHIKDAILKFVGEDKSPEFWAYYADYDWVVFCWLFGAMIDLPKGWPMYCRDLKQEADRLNVMLPKQDSSKEHNALFDAMWVKKAYYAVFPK